MVTTVSNSLSQSTKSCSSSRAVWVQHLGRFAEGIALDKNRDDNHFHYDFFQSVEALEFIDDTERNLFCQTLGLFLGDDQIPLFNDKTIIALKNAVITMRHHKMNQMTISFLEIGVVPDCSIYNWVIRFIKNSNNYIPQSKHFWVFIFDYLAKDREADGFYSLLQKMNKRGFLNRINYSTLNEIYESILAFGIDPIKNLIHPILNASKQSNLQLKFVMLSCIELDLFQLRLEYKKRGNYQIPFINKKDFRYTGIFIKEFWLSDYYQESRTILGLNISPEKEFKKYSLIGLSIFWVMIHRREYLIQSFNQHGNLAYMIPQFPEDFTLKKLIQYLPKGMVQNIRYYLRNNINLLTHLALGNNIRSFPNLPFPLSKKAAHYCFEYLAESENFDIAIKKATLKCWGMKDGQMYDSLDLGFRYFKGEYWSFVWKVVIPHIEKIRAVIPIHYFFKHLGETFDKGHFIYKKDLESEITFYLKEELKRQKASTWDFATFFGYETSIDDIHYRIIQLDNPRLLTDEGAVMKHCVRTYESSCKNGRCSIWSLRSKNRNGKEKRHATIEVSKYNNIVQVQAKANKKPKLTYRDIILEWAIMEDLDYKC